MTESSASREEPIEAGAVSAEPTETTRLFRALFEDEFDFVYRTLRRFGVREADAADQAQEVFVVVHQLLPDFDAGRPVRPWLVAIAYRIAARYRTLFRNQRERLDVEAPEPVDMSAGAAHRLEQEEMRALALEAMDQIDLSRRAIFILAELEEQPVPEIAQALGIPLNTAYSRLRLAREDFEKAVQRLTARKGWKR